MFSSFLTSEDSTAPIRDTMKAKSFVASVISAIDRIDPQKNSDLGTALFRLTTVLYSCRVLDPTSLPDASIRSLTRDLPGAPTSLLNAQWAAVSSVIMQTNPAKISPEVPRLLALLVAGDSCDPYHVSVIGIVEKVAVAEAAARAALLTGDLAGKIGGLLGQFPRHTILGVAVTNLVVATIEFAEFSKPLLDVVVPIAVSGIAAAAVEQRAFAWHFFSQLKKSGRTDGGKEVWDKVDEISRIVGQPYGGEVARSSQADIGGGMSAEQLLMLLRLFAAGRGG
jgi:hypothetical protein